MKRSSGEGKLAAGCRLPGFEECVFALVRYASVKHGHAGAASRARVGAVRGTVAGGASGKLTVRLNSAGRRYLKQRSFHAEAKGSVRSTGGLFIRFHRRLKIKRL